MLNTSTAGAFLFQSRRRRRRARSALRIPGVPLAPRVLRPGVQGVVQHHPVGQLFVVVLEVVAQPERDRQEPGRLRLYRSRSDRATARGRDDGRRRRAVSGLARSRTSCFMSRTDRLTSSRSVGRWMSSSERT